MSREKEAKYARRWLRERAAKAQPLKVVPSKKGLVTVYLFCASLGFASGVLFHYLVSK